MPWVSPVTTVEMEFSGIGGGWTDVSVDLTNDRIVFEYGIRSFRPEDRMAESGFISFGLRNDANNSGGVLGYYSPFGASKRAGFGFNIRVRVKQTYGGNSYYLMGRLAQVHVVPGQYEMPVVQCVAVDYIDDLARTTAPTALQESKRSDEVFSAVLANVAVQPGASSIGAGKSTFVYALDNVPADRRVLATFADLMRSELGYGFCKRDSTVGQTLVFEHRHVRAAVSTVLVTLSNTMHELELPGDRSEVLNRFRVTVHPRIATTGLVVAKLDAAFDTALVPGESQEVWMNYTDPVQRDTKIGATAQVTPVATTDYTMNTLKDGTGTDVTVNFGVTATFFASAVKWVNVNNGTLAGFVRTMQVRGTGLFALNSIDAEAKDQASIDAYGDNLAEIDCLYQSDPYVGFGFAQYLTNLFADTFANVPWTEFVANQSDALMVAALTGDISSKIKLEETVAGLTTSQAYYVNGVRFEVEEFEKVTVRWWLTPADTASYWLLGTVGASELGVSIRLGYV